MNKPASNKKNIYKDKYNLLLNNLTLSEILSGKLPKDSILKKRYNYSIYFKNKIDKSASLSGFLKKENKSILKINKDNKINIIKGQSAHQGVVRGKIKFIRSAEESKFIKKGEILLVTNTTPEYLSAITKSSAIIADEGGMLCHAVIVSRELKSHVLLGQK